MATRSPLDLEILGSRLIMPQNSPDIGWCLFKCFLIATLLRVLMSKPCLERWVKLGGPHFEKINVHGS